MSPEEKPPNEVDSDSLQGFENKANDAEMPVSAAFDSPNKAEPALGEPVMAEVAGENANPDVFEALAANVQASGASLAGYQLNSLNPPPLAGNLQNMSANGGAVGALVLGIWCVAGSFVTSWSIINGVLGLLMGLWGLSSRKQRMAWIGIGLCVLGIFLALFDVSESINMYLNQVEEETF